MGGKRRVGVNYRKKKNTQRNNQCWLRGAGDASESNITMAAQGEPKSGSNLYWLVMVALEKLLL